MRVANICINHKQTSILEDNRFLHIQVGAAISTLDLQIERDDTGLNISRKNPSYSELTGLYWFWKNCSREYDIVVLNHYRRTFLDESNQKLTTDKIVSYLTDFQVILPFKKSYPVSITEQYEIMHYKEDFNILKEVLNLRYPNIDFEKYWDRTNSGYLYNMFAMKMSDFNLAMSFIFSTLEEVEKRVDISGYSTQQKRIYGFMGERLLSLYCQVFFSKIKELPIEFENMHQEKIIIGIDKKKTLNKFLFIFLRPFKSVVSYVLTKILRSRSK